MPVRMANSDAARLDSSPGVRTNAQRFAVVLIKPSHYDDDGYVIQWFRSAVPSNSLEVMHGLTLDCRARNVLGADVAMDTSMLLPRAAAAVPSTAHSRSGLRAGPPNGSPHPTAATRYGPRAARW